MFHDHILSASATVNSSFLRFSIILAIFIRCSYRIRYASLAPFHASDETHPPSPYSAGVCILPKFS
ncbi:hypothetical protein BDW75DRAFT_218442 [Aspergillus navahoensis]